MKYKSFTLQNFKGIKALEIPLINGNTNPQVLLGLNESGKTTILQGMHIIGQNIKSNDIECIINRDTADDYIPIGSNETGQMVLRCEIKHGSSKYAVHYCYRYENSVYVGSNLMVYHNDTEIVDGDEIAHTLNTLQQQTPHIWYYSDFYNKVPDDIYFLTDRMKRVLVENNGGRPIEDVEKYMELVGNQKNIAWHTVFDEIYAYSVDGAEYKDGIFQDSVVDFFDLNPGSTRPYDNRLADINGSLTDKIATSWKAICNDELVIKVYITSTDSDLPGYKRFGFRVEDKHGTVYNIRDRSLGFNWFFSFTLNTLYKSIKQNNSIFLLDEPASNLHSTAQEVILKAIKRLTHNSYVVYATHSPSLLDITNIDNIYVVNNIKNKKESNIRCQHINTGGMDDENSKKTLIPLLQTISYKLPRIVSEIYADKQIEQDDPQLKKTVQTHLKNKLSIRDENKFKAVISHIKNIYAIYNISDVVRNLIATLF